MSRTSPRNVHAMRRRALPQPPLSLLWSEARTIPEFFGLLASAPVLQLTPIGDGHPVLVLPPFGTDDHGTALLRTFIASRGYRVHGWGLGRNVMRSPRLVAAVPRRLEELHARHGQPVSLVGWSAGGLWARHLAREAPARVRQVITLGTPFRLHPSARHKAEFLYDLVWDDELPAREHLWNAEDTSTPLPTPVTAIYSASDEIADWRMCVEERGERRENVEVHGSHSGLGHNPAAYAAIADRLAQPVDGWRPFSPPAALRHLFPRPRYFQPLRHPA
jgi:pimeloyl-ACP methyl ester carboxylesterase